MTRGGREGYTLSVTTTSVEITALSAAGVFYGVQTLLQLFPVSIFARQQINGTRWVAPGVEIEDGPRFHWRGLMLDSGHDFQPVATVKHCIELMSLYKFNTLHWHLTDIGTWSLAIPGHPELLDSTTRGKGVGQGYYTASDITNIVEFAEARHVTIVPEIDLPSHVVPILKAYPDFNCPLPAYGINGQLCLGNPKIYPFIRDVLAHVCSLFPTALIHIGGDECDFARWKACPRCQAMLHEKKLSSVEQLYGDFIRQVSDMLHAQNRQLLGWDDILKGGLPPNATVMSWHWTDGGMTAAKAGHNAIMVPTRPYYFNLDPAINTIERVYQFEPISRQMSDREASRILGVEGAMWIDSPLSEAAIDRRIYPRALALAETGWSPKAQKDYARFWGQLPVALQRLDYLGVGHN